MLFLAFTGCLFGLWAIFGGVFSLFSLIFVIGIPITGLFLLSTRGIALIEGRIVEALLGIRMPRKPVFVRQGLGPWEKFKSLLKDPYTWKSLAYLILLFPFGWLYFGLSGFALALALSFIFAPVLELIFHLPLELYGTSAFTPVGMLENNLHWAIIILSFSILYTKRCSTLIRRDQYPDRLFLSGSGFPIPSYLFLSISLISLLMRFNIFLSLLSTSFKDLVQDRYNNQ